MKPKSYPPYDEEPMRAAEPAVDYRRTDPATYRHRANVNRSREQEKLDELEREWSRPLTMADIHRRIDEAEAEIEAGEVMTCEEANAEIRRLLPWLS